MTVASMVEKTGLLETKSIYKKKVSPSFSVEKIPLYVDEFMQQLLRFEFKGFYHPYFERVLEVMNKYGFTAIFEKGLLDLNDADANGDGKNFKDRYQPDDYFVKKPFPSERFTFTIGDPYAQDNWMTFYHIIILIVETLLANNKNDEAILWIEKCLYNPKAIELAQDPKHPNDNAKYWKLPVFKDEITESVTKFFNDISDAELQQIVTDLQANPFNPFLVAYRRPQEFMMYIVNLYVRAHISQGDINFRMAYNGGGMDYLNLALEYYKIANLQLGERMQTIPNILKKKPQSYFSLKQKGLKPNANALVQFENIFPFCSQNTLNTGDTSPGSLLGGGLTFYFSVPPDKHANDLHDLIDDRLFKLRNCRDIDGIIRKIDLFGTPINPAQLLSALAKGLSLGQILGSLFAPPPTYKTSFSIQKSKETLADLRAIGGMITSAIEKGTSEEFTLMQARMEKDGLNRMIGIKERQVYQAQLEKQGALKQREAMAYKVSYYQSLLGNAGSPIPPYTDLPGEVNSESPLPADLILNSPNVDVDVSLVDGFETGLKLIPKERQEIQYMNQAASDHNQAAENELTAATIQALPDLSINTEPFGCGATLSYGSRNLAAIPSAIAKGHQNTADRNSHDSALASKFATLIRREQDWTFQVKAIQNDIIQLDKTLAVHDIKIQSGQIELDNLKSQMTESQEKYDFHTNKETNYKTYQAISDRLKRVHKNFYNLAMHYARSAEQAYQFERPEKVIDFISYNYDDSLIGCSTVAEELSDAIHQMEKAYLADQERPLEMKINIQLSRLDPMALLQLRKTGTAKIDIPEWFLLQQNRSIFNAKWISVNFTFPLITAPYINMNALVTLETHSIRKKAVGGTPFDKQPDDDRFVTTNVHYNKIIVSHGMNDAGYNLDPSATSNEAYQQQYRPFEHAGVISTFNVDLNNKDVSLDYSQVDWNTLSDVIITGVIRVELDGGTYKKDADTYLSSLYKKFDNKALSIFIDLKHDQGNEVRRFKADANVQDFSFTIDQTTFPYIAQEKDKVITGIEIITKDDLLGQPVPFNLQGFKFSKKPEEMSEFKSFTIVKENGDVASINVKVENNPIEVKLKLSKENVSDTYIILNYTLAKKV
jgi:hypothetical protein